MHELQRHTRARVAVLRALLQADFARGDDGSLRTGENAVGEDQQEDEEDFGTDRPIVPFGSTAVSGVPFMPLNALNPPIGGDRRTFALNVRLEPTR
jgi:hypothetical protein